MLPGERTLSGFVHGEERRSAHGTGGLAALVEDIALAAARIAEFVGKGALAAARRPAGATNASGDAPQPLAAIANEIFVRATHGAEALPAALASGQTARPHPVASELRRGRYLLLFEALDAAPDIEANAPAGSIFSVLRATDGSREPAERDFLQPGTDQVCAGYAIYGPATMLVLTFGRGVHAFTLDRARGEFVHTHPDLRIPQKTTEFATDRENARFGQPAVRRDVEARLAARSGARARDVHLRRSGSLVAEAHRILVHGGAFLSLRGERENCRAGRLRLLHEANPIGMVIEQAGGRASTGDGPVLEVEPRSLEQRTGFVFGARREVERIERDRRDRDDRPCDAPLFGERGLFRTGSRL
ncbi:MAG: fructose-1,6-bisphosphatase [Burkholderiales bacterium]|nr:fructose-1,6-bisphosphatase [Burkholderiales bacterium]